METFDYAAAFFPAEGQPLNRPPAFELDVWAECDAPQFEAFVRSVSSRMQAHLPAKRWSESRTRNLRLLLCNFVLGHHRRQGRGIKFYRSPKHYTGRTVYRPGFVSGKVIPRVVDALAAAGLIYYRKGQWDVLGAHGSMSQAAPTPDLITLWEDHGVSRSMIRQAPARPAIELRAPKKGGKGASEASYGRVEPPTPPCEASAHLFFMGVRLQRIDRHLSRFALWVPEEARKVDVHADDLWNLHDGCWLEAEDGQAHRWIDLHDTRLRRIFNNVNPADYRFDSGGRFYGAWWQSIRSEDRSKITIDGERTVEVDYVSFHPRMIYHRARIGAQGDLYALPSLTDAHPTFDSAVLRKAIKTLWLVVINSSRRQLATARRSDRTELLREWKISLPECLHPADVIDLILKEHPQVADQFGVGVGLKLQAIDAQICEAILIEGANNGIPILPIHDSFVVRARDKDFLKTAMTYHYKAKLGFDPAIEEKVVQEPSVNQERMVEFNEIWEGPKWSVHD